MPLTPQITLTVNLLDLQGNQIGAVGNPAIVEIALAGFGPLLPVIAGTGNLAKVGPLSQRLFYVGAPITVQLWGNDVITPAGTYYVISIFDDQLNLLQTGAYVFAGSISADLSTLPQVFPSAPTDRTGRLTRGRVRSRLGLRLPLDRIRFIRTPCLSARNSGLGTSYKSGGLKDMLPHSKPHKTPATWLPPPWG